MDSQENNRKKYIEAVKAAFFSIAKKNLVNYLMSFGPFMAWGPIPLLISMFAERILSKAFEGAETIIFFKFVDFRVAIQNEKFTAAAIRNYEAQQNGTKEEKDEAEKELIKAHDDFVKLNHV